MNKKYALLIPSLALASLSFASAGSEKDVALPPPPPPSCAWTLGASALYLEADGLNYNQNNNDQDYELAYRLDLTYDNGGAFGYRLTYFDFEGTDGGRSVKNNYSPEISAIDLELVRDLTLGSLEGSYSFGLRYLEFDDVHGSHTHLEFSGWGPTAGIDLATPISGPWSVYANARASWVFGDDDLDDSDMNDLLILEAGLGVQYTFGGCDSYVRLGLEAQRYFDVDADGYEDDVDLAGLALRVGFRF